MSWSGVKIQSIKSDIESWCKEMGVENYTINSQGEIDVSGNVYLSKKDFKEVPYKFGRVGGWFNIDYCKKLTSLKNCPNEVGEYFSCSHCSKLNSLEGCPKEVNHSFFCYNCKQKFFEEEVRSLCKVKMCIIN